MSEKAPDGFYVYQPDPPRPDGRIYSVSGFDSFDVLIKRLTRAEAQTIADALNASRAAYVNVWILIQDFEVPGTKAGIRGVFQSQADAEAAISAIRADHPDLSRSDFCIQVERIRPGTKS